MYILCSINPPSWCCNPDFFFFVCVCMQKSVVRIVVLNPVDFHCMDKKFEMFKSTSCFTQKEVSHS